MPSPSKTNPLSFTGMLKIPGKIPGKIKSLASTNRDTNSGTPTKTKPGKRSEAEAGLPDRSPRLRAVSNPPQQLSLPHSAPTETQSLYAPEESMDEDVFRVPSVDHAEDSQSYHSLPIDVQVTHLLHVLTDASKIVASLQHLGSIHEAQDPSILILLNNITTPIIQFPLQTALEHQNRLQEDLNALKADMASVLSNTAYIKVDVSRALKSIQDTATRVSNLESAAPTPVKPSTPALPPTTSTPKTKQPVEAKTPVKLPTLPPPSSSHHPSRLVIQFPPDGLSERDKKDPHLIVRSVNAALEKNPRSRHLRVVAAKFSMQGNLILSTRADQTAAELAQVSDVIAPIINPNNLPIVFREDKKWYKIQIDGVSTTAYGYDGTHATHNSDSIHNELSSCNPAYASALAHIVAPPRWMRTYEELRSIPRSSVVFAVDDEALAKSILLTRSLAIFGRHCSLRAYQDRPPVTQCKHCWGWNHRADLCKKPQTCRICSQEHSEASHTEPTCTTCAKLDEGGDTSMRDGPSCLHNLKCSNCIGAGLEDVGHAADARRCPSRLEKYGTARSNECRPDSTNPWKTVASKPRKKTRPPTTATTTTPLDTNNRFVNLSPIDFTQIPYSDPSDSLPPLPPFASDWTSQTPPDSWE